MDEDMRIRATIMCSCVPLRWKSVSHSVARSCSPNPVTGLRALYSASAEFRAAPTMGRSSCRCQTGDARERRGLAASLMSSRITTKLTYSRSSGRSFATCGVVLSRRARKRQPIPSALGAVTFYRRVSWRGAFWAALFFAAIRRTKMNVQKEARTRLRTIAPPVMKFVEAKVAEILSVDVVNDNMRRQSQPHRRWVEALLASALTYRDIGATIVVVDPNGTRHTVSESFLRRATDVLSRHIADEEDGERVVHLFSRTLDEEVRAFPGKPDDQRLMLYVPSPIDEGSFSLSIRERDKGTEQLNVRLVEEWRHRLGRFIPATGENVQDPRKKVMGAATALVEKLGRPPLDEDYEDSAESALFA